jgi:hypothetical protein
MDMTTTVKAWEVIIYDPNDAELPEEDRKIILSNTYKTIRLAQKEILDVLKPYDMEVSEVSLRKISSGTYESKISKISKCIKVTKCKLEKNINYKKI